MQKEVFSIPKQNSYLGGLKKNNCCILSIETQFMLNRFWEIVITKHIKSSIMRSVNINTNPLCKGMPKGSVRSIVRFKRTSSSACICYTLAVGESTRCIFKSNLLPACFKGTGSFARWPTFATFWILDLTWGGLREGDVLLFIPFSHLVSEDEDHTPLFYERTFCPASLWNLDLKKDLQPWKKCRQPWFYWGSSGCGLFLLSNHHADCGKAKFGRFPL